MKASDLKAKTVNAGKRIWYKTKDIAEKAVDAGKNGVRWAIENPDKAAASAAAGAALLGGATKLVRSVNRNVTARRELHDKKIRVYDPSLKAFVYTKKQLSNKDIDMIYAEKRRTGERVCEIMARKGMLRK